MVRGRWWEGDGEEDGGKEMKRKMVGRREKSTKLGIKYQVYLKMTLPGLPYGPS